MTYTEKATLAQDNDFRSKIQIAATITAGDKLADDNSPFIVRKYAAHISNNIGGGWLNTMVYYVLANPAIEAAATDADIQFTINENFEKLAEAHYANI